MTSRNSSSARHGRPAQANLLSPQCANVQLGHGAGSGAARHQPAALAEAFEARRPRRRTHAVDHHVDAFSVRQPLDCGRNVRRPVVDRLAGAQIARPARFLLPARRHDHHRAEQMGDLNGSGCDPAARADDQRPLSRAKPRLCREHAPGGRKDERRRRRVGEGHTGRNRVEVRDGHDGKLGECPAARPAQGCQSLRTCSVRPPGNTGTARSSAPGLIATRSPGLQGVRPPSGSPSASTMPAPSAPPICGSGSRFGPRSRTIRSRWLRLAARMRTSASPGPGAGVGASSKHRTSGAPGRWNVTARMSRTALIRLSRRPRRCAQPLPGRIVGRRDTASRRSARASARPACRAALPGA